MKKGVTITVGMENAAIVGSDNHALQAAVDYVSGLGGGTVYIGPGVYQSCVQCPIPLGWGCSPPKCVVSQKNG